MTTVRRARFIAVVNLIYFLYKLKICDEKVNSTEAYNYVDRHVTEVASEPLPDQLFREYARQVRLDGR